MNFRKIYAAGEGTLTGYVRRNGKFFGLTTFHITFGEVYYGYGSKIRFDIFNTITKIWHLFGFLNEDLPVNTDNNRRMDYSFIEVEAKFFERISNCLYDCHFLDSINLGRTGKLIGLFVKGFSTVHNMKIRGMVDAYNLYEDGKHYDVRIILHDGRTDEGDSGMLWSDLSNNGLCMHIAGKDSNGIKYSYGIFLDQIINKDNFLISDI
ncbi:hypothetical protein [Pleomorphovibrio marinus]|uniref:hypothetical protein n=1 Tax=Pleomorphovibrio marinus TaxID=2164132 RepID=UPI000E0A8DD3|nr:hypothetical protein [Pleomorphovibrio marinus]